MIKNLIGLKFGKLIVVDFVGINKNGRRLWKCNCECGNTTNVSGSLLVNGTTSSCGCLIGKKYKNVDVVKEAIEEPFGKSRTSLYKVWTSMKNRCNNPNNSNYSRYGERGIKVCDEWENNYEIFKRWALTNGYDNDLSIDRIDNEGNYEPNNCRWVNMKEQSNNTRRNRQVTYKGMTKNLIEWAEYYNIPYNNLTAYISRGSTPIEALDYYLSK